MIGARRLGDDLLLFLLVRIANDELEHETVELRLGEVIRPLVLDRILRCKNEKRFRQHVRVAAGRDLVFLHRFEERGLRLGWGAVDFVSEDDVREHRALRKAKLLPARAVVFQQFGARDVAGHQIGRELHTRVR